MELLIGFMIFSGSTLMVYNIVRYAAFLKRSTGLEKESSRSPLLIVPLLLLVFFLVGYVVVGFSGIANLMMASILLGGSIFVFLLLTVMFSIVRHIRETDDLLSLRYEEMHSQVKALTRDALGVVLVNLRTMHDCGTFYGINHDQRFEFYTYGARGYDFGAYNTREKFIW